MKRKNISCVLLTLVFLDKNCQCYCSEKGDFRDKVENDKPVYVENDPNGVYCYCKQWDLDKYPGPAKRDE